MNYTESNAHAELAHDAAWAEKQIVGRDRLHPMFILRASDGGVLIHTPRWQNDQDKDKELLVLRAIGIAHDVVAASIISEAWAADPKPGHSSRPSEREDRREVVIVSFVWRDVDGEMHVIGDAREIERSSKGRVKRLVPFKSDVGGHEFSGSMTEIVPPQQFSAESQAMAREMLEVLGVRLEFVHPGGRA